MRRSLLYLLLVLSFGCAKVGEDADQRIYLTQFSLPYGNSKLLGYDFPALTPASEVGVGKLSARMSLRPGGEEIWIGGEGSNDLTLFSVGGDSILARINLGHPVSALAFDRTGARCLVSHGATFNQEKSAPRATLVDAAARRVLRVFEVGHRPRAACFDPTLPRAFVANTGSSTLSLLGLDAEGRVDSLAVAAAPQHVVADPHGRWLYVACIGATTTGGRERGVVQIFSLPALELLLEFEAGAHPARVTPTPDGALIVVSDMWIAAGDAPRVRLLRVGEEGDRPRIEPWREIEVGNNPLSGGMSPDGRLFAAPDYADCRVGLIDLEKGRFLRWLQLSGNPGAAFSVDALWARRVDP